MKATKRIISLLLALIICVSVMFSLELNAFATDTATQEATGTAVETETEIETQVTDENLTPTVEVTEEATEVETQAVTEAPTEKPTVKPTQKPVNNEPVYDNTKVGKVSKLNKNSKYTDRISFYWNRVDGAQGYRIYYKNNDKHKDYKFLVATTSTKVTVRNLSHTTPYQFKVTAYAVVDGVLYEGDACVGKTATQPATMSKATLKKSSPSIAISWSKNSRADGYRIYRQDSSTNGKLVLYKTIKKNTTTTFEDKKVTRGKAYNYQVRAYREMYKGKTYMGEGSTLRTVAGLSKPKLNKCTSQLRRVTIDWNNNSVASGFDVYYKADDRSSYKLLKTTKHSYINTSQLRAGRKYSFKIRPFRYVGAKKVKVYGSTLGLTKTVTSSAYGKNPGKTYIEISITNQHMWFYKNGKCIVSTPVVTGNQGYYSTPKGFYKIWQRSSPATLTGPTWNVNVNYWMAFTYSGCGIHDSTWRSSSEYGGTTYKGNGSHGCVNTPYSKVKKIYQNAKMGTPVIVY